jgi:hypothetical protein
MVTAITVGMPDFNGGTRQWFCGIKAIIDMAGDFDWNAGQLGEIQVAILQFHHAGHMIGPFNGFDGESAGLFFRSCELAALRPLEWLCKVKCGRAKGSDDSAGGHKSASSKFHCWFSSTVFV